MPWVKNRNGIRVWQGPRPTDQYDKKQETPEVVSSTNAKPSIADPDDERHGTTAGYYAHYRAGLKPCEPCKQAFSEMYAVKAARALIECLNENCTNKVSKYGKTGLCRKCAHEALAARKKARILDPADPRHGTSAGNKAHRVANDDPCARCKEARREELQMRRRGPERVCTKCAKTFHGMVYSGNSGGVCRSCYERPRRIAQKTGTCVDCGIPVRAESKRCRSHAAAYVLGVRRGTLQPDQEEQVA